MLKRGFEITFGVLIILLGVFLLVTPGPGVAVIVAGLMFVSPQHGRRAIYWLTQLWKWAKGQWYRLVHGYKRVLKNKKHKS